VGLQFLQTCLCPLSFDLWIDELDRLDCRQIVAALAILARLEGFHEDGLECGNELWGQIPPRLHKEEKPRGSPSADRTSCKATKTFPKNPAVLC